MSQKESWGAIVATKEAHSTQRGQPPRMHGPGLWRYEQNEQRVAPVPISGVNCDLWCPGWDSKLEQRPRRYSLSKTLDTPPYHGTKSIRNKIRCCRGSLVAYSNGIRSAAGGAVSSVHKACRQIRVHVMKYQRQWCTQWRF